MPRRKNVPRRELHREMTRLGDLAILEEDKRNLEMRVARLDTGMAWAEDPPSRTRHLIGNLAAAPLENGEVEAKTAFLVYRSHLETDHQLLSGCREDVLRKVNGAWGGAGGRTGSTPTSCSTRTSASSSRPAEVTREDQDYESHDQQIRRWLLVRRGSFYCDW